MNSAIFSGQVSHARRGSVTHRFNYRLFMMYLDLAELPRVFDGRWFWSTRRAALARFRRSDHFGDPNLPLDECVRDLVESETGSRPTGAIRLLTHLSYFGFCFNPISIYYCFDESGENIEAYVAEVTNTPWGERHCYVLPASEDFGTGAASRFKSEKRLHVSPFMEMAMTYDWLITQPGQDIVVRIDNHDQSGPVFRASMILKREEINGPALARALIHFPFMTLRVVFRIHWQALRLWWKGCRIVAHPQKTRSAETER